MRAIKATALLAALAAVPTVLAASVTFTDVAGTRYAGDIGLLSERGIVEGYADGTYRPDAAINRAEFLKIVMDARYPGMASPDDLRCFADMMTRTPQWYSRPVCLAKQLGIVGGYPDGTFKPEQGINLAEALKIAYGAFGIRADAPQPGAQWYEPYLNLARARGVLLALLKTPGHKMTRGEFAAVAAQLVRETEDGNPSSAQTGAAVCGNGVLETGEQCDDGNLENSDGCSQLCIIVPEPVRLAILQVDAQTTGTISDVSRGKKNVTLIRFSATVDRQDALFSGVTFMPSSGSFNYAQNYVLAVDTDGDGRYETTVGQGKALGSRLTFDTLSGGGVPLYENIPVRFEVRADITSSLGPVSLGVQFATTEPDYVRATGAVDGIPLQGIETDNHCPNDVSVCFIRVNTLGSTDINVQQRGNLYVTADSTPVSSRQVLGGSISDPLLRLRLRADGEDIDVRNLRIDGGVSSIDSLLLFRVSPGGTVDTRTAQPFAQATNGQCETSTSTRFCANLSLNMLRIPANTETVVVVAAKAKNDQEGAVSGQAFALSLSPSVDSTHAVDARGVSSLADLAQNDGNASAAGEVYVGTASPGASTGVSGPMNDLVLAKLSAVQNARQSDVTGVPTGKTTFAGFTLSASAHDNSFHGSNDVVIGTLFFQVTAQNVQVDPASYRLYNPENPAATVTCSAPQSTGTFTVTCTGIDGGVIQGHIGQGQQATYLLDATIVNSQVAAGASSLTAELATLGQRGTQNAVTWSDEATTLQWADVPYLHVQSTFYHQQ